MRSRFEKRDRAYYERFGICGDPEKLARPFDYKWLDANFSKITRNRIVLAVAYENDHILQEFARFYDDDTRYQPLPHFKDRSFYLRHEDVPDIAIRLHDEDVCEKLLDSRNSYIGYPFSLFYDKRDTDGRTTTKAFKRYISRRELLLFEPQLVGYDNNHFNPNLFYDVLGRPSHGLFENTSFNMFSRIGPYKIKHQNDEPEFDHHFDDEEERKKKENPSRGYMNDDLLRLAYHVNGKYIKQRLFVKKIKYYLDLRENGFDTLPEEFRILEKAKATLRESVNRTNRKIKSLEDIIFSY